VRLERFSSTVVFFCESHALFTGLANIDFSKINFETGSQGTIYTFKNYFAAVFSVFSNKQYPNRLLMSDKFPCFIFFVGWVFSQNNNNNNNAFTKLWMTNGLGPIHTGICGHCGTTKYSLG